MQVQYSGPISIVLGVKATDVEDSTSWRVDPGDVLELPVCPPGPEWQVVPPPKPPKKEGG